MGRVSQRHRLEVGGLDSSGRGPLPGTNYIEQAQALQRVKESGTDVDPAIISVQGDVYAGTETLNVDITPDGGPTANLSVAAVAGNAADQAKLIATLIDGEAEFTAVAVGQQVRVLSVLPVALFTIDGASIS